MFNKQDDFSVLVRKSISPVLRSSVRGDVGYNSGKVRAVRGCTLKAELQVQKKTVLWATNDGVARMRSLVYQMPCNHQIPTAKFQYYDGKPNVHLRQKPCLRS
jgi:hypothetical protein